ncbi:unnamed protein product [Paramecium pentaurelia]|uniref:NFX1-type zinc finger-containing protein 1 n=1 Tax=Paramecium pentaurelia TaxID=43138 RepID=A0A8S1TC18_9CILI|nr:unnamed protein product [Paramecium pentaurelia]
MSDYDSDIEFEQCFIDDGLSNWIRNCYIKNYNVDKILCRLNQEKQLEKKLEYLHPNHQQFDSYYYLIKQINQNIRQYQSIDLYLELLIKSQSFSNEILERCHLIITQTDSIYNLQSKIEELFQIFYCLKDIDMNILKQSNISLIFSLCRIIKMDYPKNEFKSFIHQFNNFLRLIQANAQKFQYKNTPVYPVSLEFIQFKGENKQIFGELPELDTKEKSLLKYLDQHFNILREDYIYIMRKSISYLSETGFYNSIKSEYLNNIGLYQNINLISFEMNNYDLLWKISLEQFDLDGRKYKIIDWNRSKKLSRGSLICITNVECHPLLFGVITQRSTNQDNYQNQNKINLEFRFLNPKSQIMEFLILLNQNSILIEYQTQIEPCIYFLEQLKKIEKLPFDNLILKNQNKVFHPKYLQQNSLYQIDLSEQNRYYRQKIDVLNESWPDMESTLDNSQLKAIKLILSKEVALIKGPPGTGKTYCGVLAVRILCENLMQNNFPILIVCSTNHALEKFLESLIQYVSSREIAKLGAIPKSAALKDIHFQYRSEIQFNWNQFKELKNQIRIIFNRLKFWPELSHKLIHNFLDDINLDKSQIDVNYILNCWIKGNRPNCSNFYDQEELRGMHKYFKNYKITESVHTNNIFEKVYESYVDDYYSDEQDEDLDSLGSFIDFEDEYQEDEFDFQQENEIKINYNKLQLHYNFDGIEEIQKQIQKQTFNPWELNYYDIQQIIQYLKFLKYKKDCLLFEDKYKQFKEMSQTLKNLYDDEEIKKLNQYKIIGVTVSSAARHLSKLQQLNSKVLVIEEAAEVLESHIACILMKNLQHLILIGDHNQLGPQLKCYDLKIKYKGNISLFERFYKNKIPYVELTFQRRMKTKFADFIRLNYGKQYQDHSYVEENRNNLDIIGLEHDLLFFNHSWLESEDKKSKENIQEAKMILQMVQYLVKVGYDQQQISVLSLYSRQVNILQKYFIKQSLNQVIVQTVDNYQGEENDIVIISLVRNNQNNQNQLGFLGDEKRINVALSRAKIGLYVFGNFDFIKAVSSNVSLWQKILVLAGTKQCLKDSITLKCLTHSTLRNVKQPNDWSKFEAGCCDKICNLNLKDVITYAKINAIQEIILEINVQNNVNKHQNAVILVNKSVEINVSALNSLKYYLIVTIWLLQLVVRILQKQFVKRIQNQHLMNVNTQLITSVFKGKIFRLNVNINVKKLQIVVIIVKGYAGRFVNLVKKNAQKLTIVGISVKICVMNNALLVKKNAQKLTIVGINVKVCVMNDALLVINRFLSNFIADSIIFIKIALKFKFFQFQLKIQLLIFLNLELVKITQIIYLENQLKVVEIIFKFLNKNMNLIVDLLVKNQENVDIFFNARIYVLKNALHVSRGFRLLQNVVINMKFYAIIQIISQETSNVKKNAQDSTNVGITKNVSSYVLNNVHHVKKQLQNNSIVDIQKQCIRKRECGHQNPCLNKCDQQCSPCQISVKKTLACGHQIMTECSSTDLQCQKKCQRQRPCGHTYPCYNYCYQPCSPCQQQILITLSCGHQIYIECQYQEYYGNNLYCRACQSNFF